jgi:hypothetical protein
MRCINLLESNLLQESHTPRQLTNREHPNYAGSKMNSVITISSHSELVSVQYLSLCHPYLP